jgi:hypothetical protein
VYRGTSPTNLSLLTTTGTATTYADTRASRGVLYYYQVVAVNTVGPGPRSNTARMLGR